MYARDQIVINFMYYSDGVGVFFRANVFFLAMEVTRFL